MTHTVIVPLVITRGSDGKDVYLYEGTPVPEGLRAGEIDRLVEGGFVKEVEAGNPKQEDGDGPQRPSESGPGSAKEKWLAYAAAVDVQVDAEASKDDIIAAVTAAGH